MPADWIGIPARWLGFTGTLLVIGAAGFRLGVLRSLRGESATALGADRRAATIGIVAAFALVLSALGRLWGQALSFVEPGEPVTADLLGVILGQTAWGTGWTTQLVASLLAAGGFLAARTLPRAGWMMALAGATAVALAAPLTGHATGSERAGAWGYPLDVVHVLGAGVWLGTLAVLIWAGLPALRNSEPAERAGQFARLVNAFSPIALAGAAIAVLAGGLLALRYLDWSLAALWESTYGTRLAFKIGWLGGVAALGAWNWRVIRPTLGTDGASTRLRRSAMAELLFAAVVLLITALLVVSPMPGEE